ncbi:MAG TPA: hypothetical protein GX016_08040, partial [Firmicutes bacterium]|jgi:hypothetical protein|nr:hypothetical protein [Bacillota bacterium]
MSKNRVGVGDWWYAQRIKKMIVAKELEIIFVRVPLREKGFTTKLGFIPANEKTGVSAPYC